MSNEQEIRNRALEEAAAECERMMMYPGGRQESAVYNNVWDAAKGIRALQSAPAAANAGELPPLPYTNYNGYSDGSEPLYTAEQMRDYAKAAIASRPTSTSAAQQAPGWVDVAALEVAKQLVQVLVCPPSLMGGTTQWTAQIQCLVADAIQAATSAAATPALDEREDLRKALMLAAVNCGHSIDEDTITLHRNPKLEGNALKQLTDRIYAAALSHQAQDAEFLRAERDHARALYESTIKILSGIHALLYPPTTRTSDGKIYMFNSPHVHEQMQALSDQIRAIPDKIAAMQSASKGEAK